MNIEPFVCIIITTFNNLADTKECLISLSKIKYKNYLIVCVDNNSTDGTIKFINDQINNHKYKIAKLIIVKEKGKYSKCINKGFKESILLKATYSLLLNNDTVVDKYFLNHLINTIEQSNTVGIVSPKMYYYDKPKIIWYAGAIANLSKGDIRHIGINEFDTGQHDLICETGYSCGACSLFSNEMLKKIDFADEFYEMYFSDVEHSIRAKKMGYSVVYDSKSMIWHKVSRSNNNYHLKEYNKLLYGIKMIKNETFIGSIRYSLGKVLFALNVCRQGDTKLLFNFFKAILHGYF